MLLHDLLPSDEGAFFKFILGIYKLKEGWTKKSMKMV